MSRFIAIVVAALLAAAAAEPDFAFEPSLDRIPGLDFVGWGFDANYRDTFFALKPQLFKFSFNDNPRGAEKTYRFPLDTKVWAVPDQVYVRTVGKTTTDSAVYTNDFTRRFTLDLSLGLGVELRKSSKIDLDIKINLNLVSETDTKLRIIQTLAEMELWQLYIGQKYLRDDLVLAMGKLKGNSYGIDPLSFQLFIAEYGSHYVDSVTLGGSVNQKTRIEFQNDTDLLQLTVGLNLKFQASTGDTNVNLDLKLSLSNLNQRIVTNTTSSATIYGGDAQFTDFVLKAGDPDAAKLLYDSWKSTLMDNPVGVRYRLVEIWTLFDDVELRREVCTAIATGPLKMEAGVAKTYCANAPKLRGGSERNGLEFLPPKGGNGI